MKNKKDFWKNVKAFSAEQYAGLGLYELVTVGLLKLNQAKLETNFENIVVILHKLFPDKFSLTYFPEYADLMRIDNTLRLDCKHVGVVTGNRPKGFVLTGKGQLLAEKTLDIIYSDAKKTEIKASFSRNRYIKLVKGVTKTSGFKKFSTKKFKEMKKFDVCESLHCTIDADEDHIKENLRLLIDYAYNTRKIASYEKISQEVLDYLEYIESHWEELIRE